MGVIMKECENNKCGHECHEDSTKGNDEHCHFFLELADCAWAEVLKEKIKGQIAKNDGEYLKKLAENYC